MKGLAFLFLLGSCLPVFIRGITLSSSACYGTNPECDYYTLDCSSVNDVIRLQDMYAGYKQQDVCMPATHCNNSDTCCTRASEDDIGRFNLKNTYDAYANCSGKQACANVQAPWQLIDYSALTSTYVHMEYTCTPETDILNFCGSITDTSPVSKTGNTVDIQFDSRKQQNTSTTYRKSCRCHVTSQDGAQLDASVTLVDVRLHSYVSKGNESQQYECSSSMLSFNTLAESCVNSTDHHDDNFRYNDTTVVDLMTESNFSLDDLYRDGRLDAPAMVWLSIKATDADRDLSVTCNEVYPEVTTSTSTPSSTAPYTTTDHVTTSTMHMTSPVTSSTSDTTPFADARVGDDEEENTALYLAIFVPLGVLVLLVCLCIIIARYRKHKRHKRLKYLREGNEYFRDAYVLDKFIIDITNQDADPIHTRDVPTDRIQSNPVYVPYNMTPTPTRSRISSISDTIPTPVLAGNSLSTMLKNSPFSKEQRLSNTARISINTDSGETRARESINADSMQGKVADEPVPNGGVVPDKVKDPPEQQRPKSNSLLRASVIINDDSGAVIRVNNIARPYTGTVTNSNVGNSHPHMAVKSKSSPENTENSIYKDKGKKETPTGTNVGKISPGNKKHVTQTEPTKAQSAGKRHEILTSSDGGVVIRIGAAPVSYSEQRKEPSNTPAIIVPETIEDRRSATAHILPAHANGTNTSVLFISNPVKK